MTPTLTARLLSKHLFPGKTAVSQGVAGPVEYYTGDVPLTKTLTVTRGAYPEVTFTVPQNIASGDAHVEYYAQSNDKNIGWETDASKNTIAVGGDGFTVNVPKILDIRPELVGDDTFSDLLFRFPMKKKNPLLVVLDWRNLAARQWEEVELIPGNPPDTGEGTSPLRKKTGSDGVVDDT